MDCAGLPVLSGTDWGERLRARRALYSAMLEVTTRCNNACVHCYMDPRASSEATDPPLEFLLELIAVLASRECLWISFTGGEPLLRSDFPTLYEATKRAGILPIVFTNARLIDDGLADLFAALPPRAISVTLYGATPETCAQVTGRESAFAQTMAGIRRLHDRGVPAVLKTVLLTLNAHELPSMRALACDLGWPLRVDPNIHPTLDGDPGPQQYRLSPAEVARSEELAPERLAAYREEFARVSHPTRLPFYCGGGRNSVYISADATVHPCPISTTMGVPLALDRVSASLDRIFHEDLPGLTRQEADGEFPCGACEVRALCGTCPGGKALEVGDVASPTEFGCRVATLRAEALGLAARPPIL